MVDNGVNPFMERKRQRLQHFLKVLIAKGEIPYTEALSVSQYNYGTSLQTAKDDLNVLVSMKALKKENGRVYPLTLSVSLEEKSDKK